MNYDKLISTPLSNENISKIFKTLHSKANIIILPNFKGNTIEDIFNNTNHAIIFVATNSKYSGHWQLLLRSNNYIYFFDSYGHDFTKLLNKVFNYYGEDAYGESYKLGQILLNSDYCKEGRLLMNTVAYQTMDKNDDTCGRHCVTCFYSFNNMQNFDFNKYKTFMDNYKKDHNLQSYDDVVVNISQELLKS